MGGALMANQWLRLWHDMPNDPKWRTISRASKQPIACAIAVYIHILVSASNATERGRTHDVCSEDIASALDMECEQVDQIIEAMQGRVLDGDLVSGWAKRQVEREDGAAERAKAWREAQKLKKLDDLNATERNRTHDERKQTLDKDKDTDKSNTGRTTARGYRLPENFDLDFQFAVDLGIQNTLEEANKFRDYWKSQPGQKGVKLDWQATWRNWCRNAKPSAHTKPAESFKERDAREGRRRWEEMTGQTHPDNLPKNIIDVIEPMLELPHVESN